MTRTITRIVLITAVLLGSLLPFTLASTPAHAQVSVGGTWQAEYFTNIYLNGWSAATTVNTLSLNWGAGSPAEGIPADNFSARFGADMYFPAGRYRFSVQADDEISIRLDYNTWEQPVINTMDTPAPGQILTADVDISAGTHHIQVDYRERTGTAYLYVSWAQITDTPAYDTQPIATVNTGALNVRAVPDPVNGAILTRIYRGQTYAVVGRSGLSTWWQLDVNGTIGWVNGSYVRVQNGQYVPVTWNGDTGNVATPGPTPTQPVVQCPGFRPSRLTIGGYARVTPGLPNNLRAEASTAGAWVGTVPGGATVYVILGAVCGPNTAWWLVSYNGLTGWTMEGTGSTYWLEPYTF